MRKSLVTVAVLALLSAVASSAHAGDKVHLQRMDLTHSPTVKLYLTVVDRDGRPVIGHAKEDFHVSLDSADQGAATAVQSFDESKEPINLVVVAEIGQPMQGLLEDAKRGIANLADALPAKSKMALLGYSGDTKRLTEQLGAASDAESAAKTMVIDSDSTELRLLNAVRTAIDLLAAAPKTQRKVIVVFSDGIDVDLEPRTFSAIGKRAQEAGIVIDTIGYNAFDPSRLKNLALLTRQSGGVERVCKTPSDLGNHFNNLIDEVKKQYVTTFEIMLAGGDGKSHDFQGIVSSGAGNDAYSNVIADKIPKATHPVPSKGGGGGTRIWLWALIGLGSVLLIGLIAWLIFREKPEAEEEEEPVAPVAQQPVAPPPQMPMKTMALDLGAGGGRAPAVGWIVATSGRYADQTFKLKPARTLIGTGADCDVKVEDQFMSSHHCEVRFENGSFKLCDLGSTNGIVVNDKKVREHELVDNDLFRLGRTEFKFKSIT
jgi:hypothetical protein